MKQSLELAEKLIRQSYLEKNEYIELLSAYKDEKIVICLRKEADRLRQKYYGNKVYMRGLIEFTNFCKNNCYYCGIRRDNKNASRYRLTKEEILDCCKNGYELGFRTFVLQGGEDPYFTDDKIVEIVKKIRSAYPDCAITLSIGEKTKESYRLYKEAGADRYLLRHETADDAHYGKLHPKDMSLAVRKKCLYDLKEIGYQVGSGFMVGTPYQTTGTLIRDLRFLQELEPDMIGIGPYIEHMDTPMGVQYKEALRCRAGEGNAFQTAEIPEECKRRAEAGAKPARGREKEPPAAGRETAGFHALSAEERMCRTLRLLSILRLMFPYALLPSTTALGTIHPGGREMGLKAGANVVMPNLSPAETRELYALYENKICTGEEAAQSRNLLEQSVSRAGYRIVTAPGHVKRDWKERFCRPSADRCITGDKEQK